MKACNRKILELFYNAKHTGRISKPDAIARVGEDDEGLVIEITWRVIGGVIADAKFRAFANPNAIAITSLMVDNIIGKSVDDALLINEQVIIDNLDEFRPEYLEVYDMVRACITEAYHNYLKRQSRKDSADEVQDYDEYIASHNIEDGEIDILQIQREIYGETRVERRGRPRKEIDTNAVVEVGEKRGRGRPRKPVDPNAVVEVGEKRGRGRPRKVVDGSVDQVETVKRGRGRPRKVVDETQVVEVGEKRGRGRPRKIIDESAIVEIGEKRGRGRPRKIVDESEIQEPTIKRGRGRPRKEVDPNLVVEVGEKRGRGRPRKPVDPNAVVEVGEKRGRGRPRKIVDETQVVEVGEKRGRGRPRKEIDPNEIIQIGEKRGRGRPKKEIKYNFPTDLDEVIDDEEVDQLINGSNQINHIDNVEEINNTNLLDEEDDVFDADYDLFKSNIRNILSGKEVTNQNYGQKTIASEVEPSYTTSQPSYFSQPQQEESVIDKNDNIEIDENFDNGEVKRGRGRPRKVVDETQVEEDGEKRGRGRPKKIVIEEVEDEHEKRGRGRPRLEPINSLTRSLNPTGLAPHTNQDIVFASKNVTTTNININVTKTTTSVEDNKATSDDYSHTTSISQQKVEVTLPKELKKDDEIDVVPNKLTTQNTFDDFDDEDDIDDSNIKDEAPTGGIEDLLKALLDD